MNYDPKITKLSGRDLIVSHEMRAAAFFLVRKYSSLTYLARMTELYAAFLAGYEAWVRAQTTGDRSFYRENLAQMFEYQGALENGLARLTTGDPTAYEALRIGLRFADFVGGRRFENGDMWESFGYRKRGKSVGAYAWAERAIAMGEKALLTLKGAWAFPGIFGAPYMPPLGTTSLVLAGPDSPFAQVASPCDPWPAAKSVLVKSMQAVPTSGVWVAVDVENGCPNYLWRGQAAPPCKTVTARGDSPYFPGPPPTPPFAYYKYEEQTTGWRLHWEDTRYANGSLPAEEKSFLDPSTELPAWPAR